MVLFPLSLKPPEGKYIFNLEIDTHFSEGYTESKFQQVSANMTQADITALLGEPLSKQNVANQIEFDELWYYSGDGACPWYDFAWVRKQVHFNKGLVVGTYTGWSCD